MHIKSCSAPLLRRNRAGPGQPSGGAALRWSQRCRFIKNTFVTAEWGAAAPAFCCRTPSLRSSIISTHPATTRLLIILPFVAPHPQEEETPALASFNINDSSQQRSCICQAVDTLQEAACPLLTEEKGEYNGAAMKV